MQCAKCGKEDADKKCGKCFVTFYCSRECQQAHWKVHKKECGKLANEHRDKRGNDEEEGAQASAAKAPAALKSGDRPEATENAAAVLGEANKLIAAATGAPENGRSEPEDKATSAQSSGKADSNPALNGKPPAPQGIPSKPYKLPPNLSDHGKSIYEKLKPVLDGPADAIGETLSETQFCEKTGDNTRRVDTRVMFELHQLMQETLKASPESTVEVFKRMLAIKMMIKKADDAGFASWASIVGQQCLIKAQEIRLTAVKNRDAPRNPEGAIQLPPEVVQEVAWLHMDAVAILHLGHRFFENCLEEGKQELLGKLSLPSAYHLYHILQVSLGFALRHTPDPNQSRKTLWQRVVEATGEREAPPFARALATYALAYEACKSEDKAAFDKYIHQTRDLWGAQDNGPLPGFIERHISMGVCKACANEMSGVMDGHEIRFKSLIASQVGGGAAANGAAGSSGGAGSGKGARLVPGASEIEPASGASSSSSKSEQQARSVTPAQMAASRAGIESLEQEMRKGYGLYEEGRMEAGVEHFARLLKKAYELPLTGMSVSLIYSLSHAHIEGAAQIRRWGKAEATVAKLREIAEHSDNNPIPQSIPTVSDQLHLWWREKLANLYSRQRKFDKTLETLEGAVPHAEKVSKRAIAAVMVLLTSAHVEAHLSGSARADFAVLQQSLDKGIAALKADPPPVGGAAGDQGPGQRAATPATQWAVQTKLEVWIKVLPMLRALEGDGLEIEAAEATLLPLAEKFDLTVGDTIFNAEQFLSNMIPEKKSLPAQMLSLNGTTLLFAFAVLLPVALMVWLAVKAATLPPIVEGAEDDIPTEL